MGCPECGSLISDKHEKGCTWEATHPTLGGVDDHGYYLVATYTGNDMPACTGKRAKVRKSKAHADGWLEVTFIDDCVIDDVAREYLIQYDGTKGVFLFPARDFDPVTEPDADPLAKLAKLIGGSDPFARADIPSPMQQDRIDMDALARTLAGGPKFHSGGFVGEPPDDARGVTLHDGWNDGGRFQRGGTRTGRWSGDKPNYEDVDKARVSNTFFCTPEDAALTYALWDWQNSTRLTTPEEFARIYPDALTLHQFLRLHGHSVALEVEVIRARAIRGTLIGHLVLDVVILFVVGYMWLMTGGG
jgi:hypothetical protein